MNDKEFEKVVGLNPIKLVFFVILYFVIYISLGFIIAMTIVGIVSVIDWIARFFR